MTTNGDLIADALEAIPNSAWLAAANHVHGGIVSGVCPVFRLPGERCSSCLHIAVTLKAYATAQLAQVERERDTALARAQTAEDVGARYTSSAALQNAVVDRLAVAEERVRMLTDYLEEALSMIAMNPRTAATLLRDALAKAADEQEGHDD